MASQHVDGVISMDPRPKQEMVNGSKVLDDKGDSMEGVEGVAQGAHVETTQSGGDAMEIDPRSHARGQTQEQISRQQERVRDTVKGLWDRR